MIAASKPRPKDLVPLTEPARDNCSEEECSDEEEILCPSVEQAAVQLQPSMAPSNTIASTSASNVCSPCLHPGPSLEVLTLMFIGCTKKEEMLTSSDEEELLEAHGLAGKINRVGSCVSLSFNL